MPASRQHILGFRVWALGALLVVAASSAAEPGQGRPWLGRPLTEALLDLQAQGLQIVFTSRLVRPDMRVEAEPRSSDPRQILDEILAPHGLQAEEREGGTLVIVRARGVPVATDRPNVVDPALPPMPIPEAARSAHP